jgi:hypothetical protein
MAVPDWLLLLLLVVVTGKGQVLGVCWGWAALDDGAATGTAP